MHVRLGLKAHCLPCAACEIWLHAAMAHLLNRERTPVSRAPAGIVKPLANLETRLSNGSDSRAVGR